jgi:hypothetical protein
MRERVRGCCESRNKNIKIASSDNGRARDRLRIA